MIKNICIFILTVLVVVLIFFILSGMNKLELVHKYEIKNTPEICEGIHLGGFSDFFYKDGYFYAITDRGPNSDDFTKDGKTYRIFPCSEYTTYLIKFKIDDNEAEIVEAIPIKGLSGIPISAQRDSIPLDKNKKTIPFDIDGADVESFIIDKDGNYWLGDEYYPSIIKLDKNLNVVNRFAPKNSEIKNPKITYNLPEEFNNVEKNLGFESMAYDGKETIYVFTQAGLKEQTNISVLKFNIKTEMPEEILKYKFPENSILSAAIYVDKGKFYIAEKLFNRHFLDEIISRDGFLRKNSILRPLTQKDKILKNLKIEGFTKDDKNNLYIINDNDFGIDEENTKKSFIIKFKFKDQDDDKVDNKVDDDSDDDDDDEQDE